MTMPEKKTHPRQLRILSPMQESVGYAHQRRRCPDGRVSNLGKITKTLNGRSATQPCVNLALWLHLDPAYFWHPLPGESNRSGHAANSAKNSVKKNNAEQMKTLQNRRMVNA